MPETVCFSEGGAVVSGPACLQQGKERFFMGVLNKLSDIVNTLVEYVVAILMGLMTIVVFVQVIFFKDGVR